MPFVSEKVVSVSYASIERAAFEEENGDDEKRCEIGQHKHCKAPQPNWRLIPRNPVKSFESHAAKKGTSAERCD